MKLYFGFAIADSMFPTECYLQRRYVLSGDVTEILKAAEREGRLVWAANPSHKATFDAAMWRFGIEAEVPAKAPIVKLEVGDQFLVMSVRGLPRLEGRHEYTKAEIASAEFAFGLWTVLP